MYFSAFGVNARPSARERRTVRRARALAIMCPFRLATVSTGLQVGECVGVASLLHFNPASTLDDSNAGQGLPAKDQVYTKRQQLSLRPSAQSALALGALRILAPDDFTQTGQAGPYGFFRTVIGRRVVVGAHQIIGQVLLGCDGVRSIMSVDVAHAMAQLLGAGIVRVTQVVGNQRTLAFGYVSQGGV